jgi:hypothetical protein
MQFIAEVQMKNSKPKKEDILEEFKADPVEK